jgi:hypothetical protein
MVMENKTSLKILLTIVTIFVIVFLPLWVGPEIIKGSKVCLFCEWIIGLVILIASAIVTSIVYFIVISIYDLWDDMID